MFRPLAFVAMRQKTDETGHAQPFALGGGDELIEHDLRAVGEVAELRFPKRQRVWLGERIAIFEAKYSFLREHRIDDLEVGLIWRQVLERREAAIRFLVDENSVALRERSAFAILAG